MDASVVAPPLKAEIIRMGERIAELETAILDAIHVLGGLSMATTGSTRGRVCSASNRLNYALGREQTVHGDQPPFKET